MRLKIKWQISYTTGRAEFELGDVQCKDADEWNALSEQDKERRLQQAIDNNCDAPGMNLESYTIVTAENEKELHKFGLDY